MRTEGASKEQAADALLSQSMTPDAIKAHMADKHPGQPVPNTEQTRQGLLATATAV
jgi:hypothetical protein